MRCTVVIGAGAVIDASQDVMMWKCVTTKSITKDLYEKFGKEIGGKYAVFQKLIQHKGGLDKCNFEDVYESLVSIAVHLLNPEHSCDQSVLNDMEVCGYDENTNANELIHQINILLSSVVNSIIAYNDEKPPKWFVSFFQTLTTINDCGTFYDFCILNYDTWIEESIADSGYIDGFEEIMTVNNEKEEYRIFNKSAFDEISNYNTLCHPHGCVKFGGILQSKDQSRDHGDADIVLWDKPKSVSSYVKQVPLDRNFESVLPLIVTGKHKNRNFKVEPYKTYIEHLNRQLSLNQSILIIGYGFGDDHINKMIKNYGRNSGRKLIIISPWTVATNAAVYELYGCNVKQDEKIWKSSDQSAVWYIGGFKSIVSYEENIREIKKLIGNQI